MRICDSVVDYATAMCILKCRKSRPSLAMLTAADMAPTAAAKRDIWTASEECELLALRDSHPDLTWRKIARLFNEMRAEERRRSSDAVSRKWHKLQNPARSPRKRESKSGPRGNFQQLVRRSVLPVRVFIFTTAGRSGSSRCKNTSFAGSCRPHPLGNRIY